LIWTKLSFSVKIEQSDVGSSTAWCKNSVTLSLFVFEFALGRGATCWDDRFFWLTGVLEAISTDVQIAWLLWVRVFSALLKRTAAITQASIGSQSVRPGTAAFAVLSLLLTIALIFAIQAHCIIEVAYIFASVKAIRVKCLVWENTARKELQPLELTSKVTTEFVYNVTSKRLHKEHYCRIEMHVKDAIATKQNVTLRANWRYKGSRYKRIQLHSTELHKVSGPIWIKAKS